MCYSKEVQLTTGTTICSMSLFYYFYYSIKFKSLDKKWLLPFLKNVIVGFLLVGSHQLFEFLTIITDNQVIYKTGLILSISSMFFFIRSLENIIGKNLKSNFALILIIFNAIYIACIKMDFQEHSFYLKHNSAFIWSVSWMFLFIYFNVCAIRFYFALSKDFYKKIILTYLVTTLNLSFILSVVYSIWGYLTYSTNVCTDSPSIWCTFFVVQIFFLPILMSGISKFESIECKNFNTLKNLFFNIILSLVILICCITFLPFFHCLSVKFVFP